jgi:hypothetical protein
VDGALATEAKTKDDDTSYTDASLKNSLDEPRSQLPAEGPDRVALRIPNAWGEDPKFLKGSDAEFLRALRGSRRINAILVLWDQWVEGTRAACLTRYRVHENLRPRTDFRDLPSRPTVDRTRRIARDFDTHDSPRGLDARMPGQAARWAGPVVRVLRWPATDRV